MDAMNMRLWNFTLKRHK